MVLLYPGLVFAQTSTQNEEQSNLDAKEESADIPLSAGGSVGISANAYTASGIENRRKPLSAQATANLSFSLFGLSSGINLLYSTTQSQFRQRINNLSFNTTWRWLTVQAGDVSPGFSKFGLNGTGIRGGYIKIAPGNFFIELTGGQSKRKVPVSTKEEFREPAYRRISVGGKVGVGTENGSHFFLSSHYSIDQESSLSRQVPIVPKENLTVTPNAQVSFLNNRVTVGAEVTVSTFTRDTRKPALPLNDMPGIVSFLGGIIRPYESTRINYAANLTTSFKLDNFGLQLGYLRIQPGFRSLGAGRIRDDRQQIQIRPTANLLNNRLSLQGSLILGRNNLFDTKFQTQKRTQVGTTASFRVTNMFIITGSYNLLANSFKTNVQASATTPQAIPFDRHLVSHSLTLQPTLTIQGTGGLTHTFSLAGSYFTLSNTFEGNSGATLPPGTSSNTFTSTLSYNVTMASGLSINAMGNFFLNDTDASQSNSFGLNTGASYSILEQKLTLSLHGGYNQVSNDIFAGPGGTISTAVQTLNFNFNANYRLTGKDSFSLSLRGRRHAAISGTGNTFAELQANFSYSHRF